MALLVILNVRRAARLRAAAARLRAAAAWEAELKGTLIDWDSRVCACAVGSRCLQDDLVRS